MDTSGGLTIIRFLLVAFVLIAIGIWALIARSEVSFFAFVIAAALAVGVAFLNFN
jgi:hypothetical protein